MKYVKYLPGPYKLRQSPADKEKQDAWCYPDAGGLCVYAAPKGRGGDPVGTIPWQTIRIALKHKSKGVV